MSQSRFDRNFSFTKIEGTPPTNEQVKEAIRKLFPVIIHGGESVGPYVDIDTNPDVYECTRFVESIAKKTLVVLDKARIIELWPYNDHSKLHASSLADAFEGLAVLVRWTFRKV